MRDFTIFPAIDLREGRVVRLSQGDPDRETHYANGPLTVARRWQDAGATWLHVVNLDGAFGEAGRENYAALARVLTTRLDVQFGGGCARRGHPPRAGDGRQPRRAGHRCRGEAGAGARSAEDLSDQHVSPWVSTRATASCRCTAGRKPPRSQPWSWHRASPRWGDAGLASPTSPATV